MMSATFFQEFFPDYLEHINTEVNGDQIFFHFNTLRTKCDCPACGKPTYKFKNYYERKIQDLPIINKQLFLMLRLKKFVCENKQCKKGIFVEPIDELAGKLSRKTKRLDELLTRIALTGNAEEGAKTCKAQKISISGDTLLRIAKGWETDINVEDITAVGVDDFAFKKNIAIEQLL